MDPLVFNEIGVLRYLQVKMVHMLNARKFARKLANLAFHFHLLCDAPCDDR